MSPMPAPAWMSFRTKRRSSASSGPRAATCSATFGPVSDSGERETGRNPMTSWLARSATFAGAPRLFRYSREAKRPRSAESSFRATSEESWSGAARSARSKPSATRSTTREVSETWNDTSGYFAEKRAITSASRISPMSAGAVMRMTPRGSGPRSTTSAVASATPATGPRTRSK